jgi:uncharacterized protein YjbJ (UPF0337 family)
MSAENKARNKTQEVKGKVKQAYGKAVDDPTLEAEGKADEVKGDLKQAGENIKDAVRK